MADDGPLCFHPPMGEAPNDFTRLLRRGFHGFLVAQERLRSKPLKYVFVLGHMRSGSSLLVHLLNSHQEICGLGESWIRYDNKEKLKELVFFVHTGLRKPLLTETYLLDKILHNDLLGEELLGLESVTSIFLVREPERSLLSLYAHRERLMKISGWESALSHYEKRLGRLASDARFINDKRRSMLVLYQQLLDGPVPCLGAIGTFLGLRSRLPTAYRVTPLTGLAGLGDFSEHIKSGQIVRTRPPLELRVPEDVLHRGRTAYETCVAALSNVCTTLPETSGAAHDA
jgi:hypothetical protein